MQRAQAHGQVTSSLCFKAEMHFISPLTPQQLPLFIMLDSCVPAADGTPQPSILSEKSVSFVAGKPVMSMSIDSFPFPYYLIVTDLTQLPQRLADALRQWFEAGRSAS